MSSEKKENQKKEEAPHPLFKEMSWFYLEVDESLEYIDQDLIDQEKTLHPKAAASLKEKILPQKGFFNCQQNKVYSSVVDLEAKVMNCLKCGDP